MEIQKKGPWSPNYDTDVLLIHGKAVKSVDNAKPCHRITGYDRHSIHSMNPDTWRDKTKDKRMK